MASDDWPKVKLGDICNLKYGKMVRKADLSTTGYPVWSGYDVVGYHTEYMFDEPEVTITCRGVGGTGKVYMTPPRCWLTNLAISMVPKCGKQVDKRFLYWAMKASDRSSLITGSAQYQITIDHLSRFCIAVPPVSVQQSIAGILGALDDKIELNRRMNRTLEAMARAIFKSWFVDFDPVRAKAAGQQPPGLKPEIAALFPDDFEGSELGRISKGWEIGTLSEFAGFVIGGDWGKDAGTDATTVAAYCIRGADIPNLQSSGTGNMPVRFIKDSNLQKRSLADGDLVIEISGGSPTQSTGRPVLISSDLLKRLDLPLICSNFCRLFRPEKKVFSKYLYLLLLWLYDSDTFLRYENGTTGIKNFAFSHFSDTHALLMPPEDVLTCFDSIIEPIFSKMQQLGNQICVLSALRDAMLPELISGELPIPNASRIAEKAV